MRILDSEEFEELIYDEEESAVIFFHRPGCSVCEALSGTLGTLEEEYQDRLLIGKIDAEAENELFTRFGLKGVPQVLFFRGGVLTRTVSGKNDEAVYQRLLDRLVDGKDLYESEIKDQEADFSCAACLI